MTQLHIRIVPPVINAREIETMDSDPRPTSLTRRQFVTSSAVALAANRFTHGTRASEELFEQRRETGGGPFRVIIDTDPGWTTRSPCCSPCARRS